MKGWESERRGRRGQSWCLFTSDEEWEVKGTGRSVVLASPSESSIGCFFGSQFCFNKYHIYFYVICCVCVCRERERERHGDLFERSWKSVGGGFMLESCNWEGSQRRQHCLLRTLRYVCQAFVRFTSLLLCTFLQIKPHAS